MLNFFGENYLRNLKWWSVLVEYGYRTKMEVVKNLGWRFFECFLKNTTRPLMTSKRVSSTPC